MIKPPKLALIAAVAKNRVIGKDGGLPWKLSSDLKHFKATTQFKPVIMGSKTWESLPKKPLPGRLNIVLTRNLRFEAEGAIVCENWFEAYELARDHAVDEGLDEIFVIGGAMLYAQTLPLADRLYLTEIDFEVDGDTFFPEIDHSHFTVTSTIPHKAGPNDDHDFTLCVYERIKKA